MPFAWNQIEPSRVGQVTKFDIPLNDWLGIKFGEGMSSGLGRAVWDMGEDYAWDTGPKIDPKILNASFGINIDGVDYLKFDEPITIGRAYLLNERKKEELKRMSYLESASHSAISKKGVAGFAAGVVGGFANPVDFSTAFIPFVGSSAKASGIARMGKGLLGAPKYGAFGQAIQTGRAAIAGGLISAESIGTGRMASFTSSMIDGVLSQAAVEIPIAIEKARNKAEYGSQDFLINVLAGGVFAGGLNLAGQALEAAIGRAVKFHSSLSPETAENLIKVFEDAVIRNQTADAANIIRVDEASIRAKLEAEKFDSVKARQEALREEPVVLSAPGQKPVAGPNEILYLIQAEAVRSKGRPAGNVAERLFQRFMEGERTHALFSQMAEFVDRQYDPRVVSPQEGLFVERVFGGERAKKVKDLNAKLKQVRTELFKVKEQKAAIQKTREEIRAGRTIAGGEAIPEIDVLRKGLEPLVEKEARLNKLLEEIEGKLTGEKLEVKRKELLGDLAGVQEKIAEQQRRIQIENERVPEKFENLDKQDKQLTERERELVAALSVGAGFKTPNPLDPTEIDVHAKAEGDARVRQEEIDRQLIAEEREKRIAELIEKKRKEWRDGLEGRISREKEAEIKRQQEQGKLLSEEDLARYQSKADADKADLELIKQDVDNVEEDLRELIGLPSKRPVEQMVGKPQAKKGIAIGSKEPKTVYEMSQDQYAVWLSKGGGNVNGQGGIYRELVKKPEYRQGGKTETPKEASAASDLLEKLEKTPGFEISKSGWTFTKIGDFASKLADGTRLKAYVTLKNWASLTPENLSRLSEALKKAGYNGQVKVPGAVPFNSWRLVEGFDNIVAHVKDEASLRIFQKEASAIFNDAEITFGKDPVGTSHTDNLATIANKQRVAVKTGKAVGEMALPERPVLENLTPEAAAARRSAAVDFTDAERAAIAAQLKELDMDVDSFLTQAKAAKGAAPCAGKRG